MGLPTATEALPFYRSAFQRFTDAKFLLEDQRTTGAVYLAGYAVECILKTLLLTWAPPNKRTEILFTFRGSHAHSFDWLRQQHLKIRGPSFPKEILTHLVFVSTWSTDFRYKPGLVDYDDSVKFLDATQQILTWADGRI